MAIVVASSWASSINSGATRHSSRAHQRGYSDRYHSPITVAGLYWHFVDLVWIFCSRSFIYQGEADDQDAASTAHVGIVVARAFGAARYDRYDRLRPPGCGKHGHRNDYRCSEGGDRGGDIHGASGAQPADPGLRRSRLFLAWYHALAGAGRLRHTAELSPDNESVAVKPGRVPVGDYGRSEETCTAARSTNQFRYPTGRTRAAGNSVSHEFLPAASHMSALGADNEHRDRQRIDRNRYDHSDVRFTLRRLRIGAPLRG